MSEIVDTPVSQVEEEQTVDVATHSSKRSSEVAELNTDLGAQSAQQQKMDAMRSMSRGSLPRPRRISDKSLQTSLW